MNFWVKGQACSQSHAMAFTLHLLGENVIKRLSGPDVHLPHASSVHAPSHARRSTTHHPAVKPPAASSPGLPPTHAAALPVATGVHTRVATSSHSVGVILPVTT